MRSRFLLSVALSFIPLCAAAQTSPWNLGTYAYDGSGNVKSIGADYYVYDAVSRLVTGSADKERTGVDNHQTYTYDPYGNRLSATTTGTACKLVCDGTLQIGTLNRITNHGATYDAAGNLLTYETYAFAYDGAGMMSRQYVPSTNAIDWQFIYGADDERVATYSGQGQWRFTIRDMDGNVIREVTASESGGSTTWTWDRDHVFREGSVLASVLYGIGVRHMHNDHLGTPRLITDGNHAKVGIHVYYPFGGELSLSPSELPNERLQFTGHERDGDLDYMHARYYSAATGRFLSPDPTWDSATASLPQSWNRYSYVLNAPMNWADPDGKCPDACLSEVVFIALLAGATGVEAGLQAPSPSIPGKTNAQVIASEVSGIPGKIITGIKSLAPYLEGYHPGGSDPLPMYIPPSEPTKGIDPTKPMQSEGGGGRTDRKLSRDLRQTGQDKVNELRNELKQLQSKPNKTPEDKKAVEKKERELKRAIDQMKASEPHARVPQKR